MPYAVLAMNSNAILTAAASNEMLASQPNPAAAEEARWNALSARDSSQDGRFVFAVSSTGVYCRPSCPARRPRRENVRFFLPPEQAEQAGYRACLRCRPKFASANAQPDSVKAICRFIEQHLDEAVTLERLGKEFRQSRFHLQRRFKAVLGITPREYADSCRLRTLKRSLQAGDSVTRAMYAAGYGSSSRLYDRTHRPRHLRDSICPHRWRVAGRFEARISLRRSQTGRRKITVLGEDIGAPASRQEIG